MELSRLLRKPRKRNGAGFFRRASGGHASLFRQRSMEKKRDPGGGFAQRRPLLGTTPPQAGTPPPDRDVPAVSPHMRGCNIADYRAETSHECHPEPHARAPFLCHPEPQHAAKDLMEKAIKGRRERFFGLLAYFVRRRISGLPSAALCAVRLLRGRKSSPSALFQGLFFFLHYPDRKFLFRVFF